MIIGSRLTYWATLMGFDFQRAKRLFGSLKALGDMAIGMTQPTDWWSQLTYDQ